jgi:hypothetical protein
MWKVIICESILLITGIISLIYWNKKIDSETTWIYGIYIGLNLILSLFVLIGIEQFWLIQK